MSETTTAATKTAEKAATKVAATVVETLPTIVETTEVALEVPTKVLLNQKAVVVISVLAGAGITAGTYWAVTKWRNRSKVEDVVPNDISSLDVGA